MRRHAPAINNSSRRQGLFKHPLLLLGLLVLVFALYRVFVMHGDLHELHESLKQQAQNEKAADASGAPADVQVLMPEEVDSLYKNATSKDINVILTYPHVDGCRQCDVCVPQSYIDSRLGNSSSRNKGWWGRLWGRKLLEQQQQQQEQQLQHGQAQLKSSTGSTECHNSSSSSSSRARRGQHRVPALRRQQQWLAALRAALKPQGNGSCVEGTDMSDVGGWQQQGRSEQGQEKQQEVQERQLEPQQQQRRRRRLQQQRPKLDGVQTHKDWLAKQARGEANTDTHTVPGVQVILDMPDNSFDWQGSTYHIGPSSLQMDAGKIRHCKVCRGCQQMLKPMPKGMHWLGSFFLHDPGASDGWLSTAESANGKQSVVKVWCVPVPKPGSRVPAVCKPSAIREQLQLVLALQNIAQDCQLGELLPKAWIGPVDGVLPGSGGYRVLWDGLWADLQVGVSAENLAHRGTPGVRPGDLLDYLQNKLNSTQVLMAAVFDLLFSQCDRHGQNLYLKPDGSLVLIDNDQSYGVSWRPCGVDSLFLPGTQKFEVERLGYSYVMKKPDYAPPKTPRATLDPLQLLDYRCHLPAGKQALGTDYPKPVTQCLKRLSKMIPDQIATKYGYPHPRMAAAVHKRAQDMLAKGFEWTLQNGWPQNPAPMRYKWSTGCCQMKRQQADPTASTHSSSSSDSSVHPPSAAGHGTYECTRWVQIELGHVTELPLGDPVIGMAWEHNGVDSGSYSLAADGDNVATVDVHPPDLRHYG